ncbi:hypothetical protein [Carboxylicivirga sp. N1Y90]|uniref:hypothetical protein n=1 Tax=Carboxylicivirga fragile TaxID=3417571 RepID=UPI003D350C9F|nr:hypothetical protein [Marinilabiliaceae bacterium N1Y90]
MQKYLKIVTILVIGISIGLLLSNVSFSKENTTTEIEILKQKNIELRTVLMHNSTLLRLLNSYNLYQSPEELKRLAKEIIDINNYQDTCGTIGYRINSYEIQDGDSANPYALNYYRFIIQEYGIGWEYQITKELNTLTLDPRTKAIKTSVIH